jgi:hypothetical protein
VFERLDGEIDLRRLFQTIGPKTEVDGDLHGWRNPELRFSFRVLHVDMGASFLSPHGPEGRRSILSYNRLDGHTFSQTT